MTDIKKLHNSQVFDGDKSLMGIASECTLPDVVAVLEEHLGQGMIMKVDLPTGVLEKMSFKIKWNSFYPDVWARGGDVMQIRKLQVFGNVNTHNANGLASQQKLKVNVNGTWTKTPGGVLAPAKQPETESELSVSYFKINFDGNDLIEVDAFTGVYKVAGQDVLTNFRKNLGG